MIDIIVEVRKGTVTGLYCDAQDARFVIIDWDLNYRDSNEPAWIREDHVSLSSLPSATEVEYRRAVSQ